MLPILCLALQASAREHVTTQQPSGSIKNCTVFMPVVLSLPLNESNPGVDVIAGVVRIQY